jgi:lysozyme family protein
MGDWKLVLNGSRNDMDDGAGAIAAKSKKGKQKQAQAKDAVELFNLAQDLSEKANLAEKNPAKVAELRARYDAFAREAVPPKSAPVPAGFKTPKVWGEAN